MPNNFEDHNYVMSLVTSAQDSDNEQRQELREAMLFIHKKDGQWEPYWWNLNKGKPRYTFDMTSPVVDQIAGEMEQADFSITINPTGGDSTKDDAKVLSGMVRNIERMSNATHVYNSAGRAMVTCGMDGWRVVQKFIDDDSFDQDLGVERISNFIDRVWFDEASEEQDHSDARWGVVLQGLLKEDYKARWPEGSEGSVSDGRQANAYYEKPDLITVGEFLYKKAFDRELVLMDNGQVIEVDDDYEKVVDELAQLGISEKGRRKRKGHKVFSRFYDAGGWLEAEKETVFSFIPVIPTYGNFNIFENKRICNGAVRPIMDYQRVYNYTESRAITEVALAPRAKIPMTNAMMAGHTDELSTLNVDDSPVLPFNPDPNLPGYIPQQIGGAQVNQGLAVISNNMQNGIAKAAGLFAANMGEGINGQSGVAIKALQDKGNTGSVKYFGSQEVAICHTARILINAIPKVYDTERQVRILGEDGAASMATLNEQVQDEQTGEVVTLNDLSKGKYDVSCSAGASFQNRQDETVSSILEMAQADPSIIPANGDILFANITAPGMDLIAERKRAELFNAGMIPEAQMTDEEKEQMQIIQQQQAQQGEQPDAMMVAAQAEMQKAQADAQEVLRKSKETESKTQLSIREQDIKMQKQQIEFAQKQQNAELNEQKFGMESFMAQQKLIMEQNKAQSDAIAQAVDNLNTQANTLKTIREASGADAIIGPGNIEAYAQQADIVSEEQGNLELE